MTRQRSSVSGRTRLGRTAEIVDGAAALGVAWVGSIVCYDVPVCVKQKRRSVVAAGSADAGCAQARGEQRQGEGREDGDDQGWRVGGVAVGAAAPVAAVAVLVDAVAERVDRRGAGVGVGVVAVAGDCGAGAGEAVEGRAGVGGGGAEVVVVGVDVAVVGAIAVLVHAIGHELWCAGEPRRGEVVAVVGAVGLVGAVAAGQADAGLRRGRPEAVAVEVGVAPVDAVAVLVDAVGWEVGLAGADGRVAVVAVGPAAGGGERGVAVEIAARGGAGAVGVGAVDGAVAVVVAAVGAVLAAGALDPEPRAPANLTEVLYAVGVGVAPDVGGRSCRRSGIWPRR
jgi:hypothetical protein